MTGRDPALFVLPAPRLSAGRVRTALDLEVKDALEAGASLSGSLVAMLRSLADQIDHLERQLRVPDAKAYDRMPLAGLVREFRETHDLTFAAAAQGEDPLTHALAEFLAAGDRGPQVGDPAGLEHD